MNLVYVDTETTGLDAERHEIWEVALIVDSGKYEGEWVYHFPVTDLATADSTALQMNGYYERQKSLGIKARLVVSPPDFEWVNGRPLMQGLISVGGALHQIARRTAGAALVGSNPAFDAQRLDKLMRKHGVASAWHYRLIDTTALAMGHLHAEVKGLADAYPRIMGKEQPLGAHSALVDARMCKDVYEAIMSPPRLCPVPGCLCAGKEVTY